MKSQFLLLTLNAIIVTSEAQLSPPGVVSPLAQTCGPSTAQVVCINKYAAVIPYPFYRQADTNGSYEDTIQSTQVPSDPSWNLVGEADFLVFDETRGFEVLGSSPTYEYMFAVNDGKCDTVLLNQHR